MDSEFEHFPAAEQYCIDHSCDEPELLKQIAKYTWTTQNYPRMISGHLKGRFLSMISRWMKPHTILEVGTFTGYSALCLSEGLGDGDRLHTIEKNPELEAPLMQFFKASEYAERITLHMGDALNIIPELQIQPDLVFLDADKEQYVDYFNVCMQCIKKGGWIVADNTLWGGKVLSESLKADRETAGIRAFNDYVQRLENIESLMLPFFDGLTLIRVK